MKSPKEVLFLCCLVWWVTAGHAAARDEAQQRFVVETEKRLERKDFLTPSNAFSLAVVTAYAPKAKRLSGYAQMASQFAPLSRSRCMLVEPGFVLGKRVWFMINNAAIEDADISSHDLNITLSYYSAAGDSGKRRSLLRTTGVPKIKFVTNPSIETDDDPAVRVVFHANAEQAVAMRIDIDESGMRDFDEYLAGSYLLIFDKALLDDGFFPECRRKPIIIFGGLGTFLTRLFGNRS